MGCNNQYCIYIPAGVGILPNWGPGNPPPPPSSSQKFAYWPFPQQKNGLQLTNQVTIFKQPN